MIDVDPTCAALIVPLHHLLVMALPSKFGEAVDNGDGGEHVAYKKILHLNCAHLILSIGINNMQMRMLQQF
eukprot:15263895-Ditylum_brightwellii.AAC.1